MSDRAGFLWLWSQMRRRGVFMTINVASWVFVSSLSSAVLLVHSGDTLQSGPTSMLLIFAPTIAALIAAYEARRVYRRTEAKFQALLRHGAAIPMRKPERLFGPLYAGLKIDLRWWAAGFAACFVLPAALFVVLFR